MRLDNNRFFAHSKAIANKKYTQLQLSYHKFELEVEEGENDLPLSPQFFHIPTLNETRWLRGNHREKGR